MKQFSSSYESPFGGPQPDVSIQDRFKAEVTTLSKPAPLLSVESMLARVHSLWSLFFGKPMELLRTEKGILEDSHARTCAEAAALQEQLNTDEIPQYLPGKTSFSPPCCFWGRFTFGTFFAFGWAVSGAEGISFASCITSFTDSWLIALFFSICVFCLPVFEAALLFILKLSEPARKMLALAQAFVGLLSGIGYILLSLAISDGSMQSAFSDDEATISLDSWRMICQLLTSFNGASLCFHAAFCIGSLTRSKNPERAEKVIELKALHDKADGWKREGAEVLGDIAEGEANKEDAILFCKNKHELLQAVREETNQIRNEPL